LEIGVDIVEISRFEKLIDNKKFLEKHFTENKIEYCKEQFKPEESFAAIFAGKEAVKKGLNSFLNTNLRFKEIEILTIEFNYQ